MSGSKKFDEQLRKIRDPKTLEKQSVAEKALATASGVVSGAFAGSLIAGLPGGIVGGISGGVVGLKTDEAIQKDRSKPFCP